MLRWVIAQGSHPHGFAGHGGLLRTNAPETQLMVKRKKPKAASDKLSDFVVDVANGDMPIVAVIPLTKEKTPQRTRFAVRRGAAGPDQ
jgi:hypothetical protein